MAAGSNPLSILFPLFSILFCVQISVHSITVDLIHRDSPRSPFYDPLATKMDRLNGAFRRSLSRATYLRKRSSKSQIDIKSQLTLANGEFVMKLSLGTPPISQLGIVDTGSDLTWFQCKHCLSCFAQRDPLFDPKLSSTYKNISCHSPSCKAVQSSCKNNSTNCLYEFRYKDGTLNAGIIASETFTLQSTSRKSVSLPKMIFGCGYYTINGSTENRSDGIIGFGSGEVSFINQARKHVSKKFSYCLPLSDSTSNATGKIRFGKRSVVTGPSVVTTPLKKKHDSPFYIITLESISINNRSFPIAREQQFEGDNDIILDSGTTFTLLSENIYDKLRSELQKVIPQKALMTLPKPLPLCYKSEGIKVPKIKFIFEGGAEVALPETSAFMQTNPGIMCLDVIRNGNLSILGNLAQANYLIGFDLAKNVVSFKPSDCTK